MSLWTRCHSHTTSLIGLPTKTMRLFSKKRIKSTDCEQSLDGSSTDNTKQHAPTRPAQ